MFVAELGDKSQLVALSFAARYPVRAVLVGLFVATACMHALAVTVGAAVAAVVPARIVGAGAGALFVVFGVLTMRAEDAPQGVPSTPVRTRAAVPTVALAFLAAELGDKTMIASGTLAATHGALATWIGATVGMFAASAIAVAVGAHLATRVAPRRIRLVAAAAFVAVGVFLLVGAATG